MKMVKKYSIGLFSEPGGPKLRHWTAIGTGLICLFVGFTGLFGTEMPDLFLALIGVFLIFVGASNILPKDQTLAAGLLRIFGLLSAILGVIVVILSHQ